MQIMEVEEEKEVLVNGSVIDPHKDTTPSNSVAKAHVSKPSDSANTSSHSTLLSESTKNCQLEKTVVKEKSKLLKDDKANNQSLPKQQIYSSENETPSKTTTKETSLFEEDQSNASKNKPPKEVVLTPLPSKLESIKTEAGNLFRAGQYDSAAEKYSIAISRLNHVAEQSPDANYSHALATLHNNRAACKLKSGDDKSCIADCERVLELKPLDIKALLRRGSAYEHMEKYKLAYEDYRAVQNVDWSVAQAQEGANRVAQHLRDIHGPKWREAKTERRPDVSKLTEVKGNLSEPSKAPSVYKTPSKDSNKKASVKPTQPQKSSGRSFSNSAKVQSGKNSIAKDDLKPMTKDEKRAQLTQQLFAKLKKEGNELVRKGNFAKAVESYNQCIKICPDEVASYTNRALCFLKLKKDASASSDCTTAIKLDAKNVKAYYRRAQASKNLKKYVEAEKDLKKVLEIEPLNKPAASELSEVQKLTRTKRKVPIQDVSDSSDSDEKEIEKKKIEMKESKTSSDLGSKTTGNVRSSSPTVSNASSSAKVPAAFDKKDEIKQKVSSKKPRSGSPFHQSDKTATEISLFRSKIPEKLTPYEFGNLWNSVQPKSNIDAYKCILDNILTTELPVMVSNKITDHMITVMAEISRKHVHENEAGRAYDILLQLTKADRFEMAAMFLSKKDKLTVQNAFREMEKISKMKSVTYTRENLQNLRKLYML